MCQSRRAKTHYWLRGCQNASPSLTHVGLTHTCWPGPCVHYKWIHVFRWASVMTWLSEGKGSFHVQMSMCVCSRYHRILQLKVGHLQFRACVEKVIIYYSCLKSWRRIYALLEITSLQVMAMIHHWKHQGEEEWIIELFLRTDSHPVCIFESVSPQ